MSEADRWIEILVASRIALDHLCGFDRGPIGYGLTPPHADHAGWIAAELRAARRLKELGVDVRHLAWNAR